MHNIAPPQNSLYNLNDFLKLTALIQNRIFIQETYELLKAFDQDRDPSHSFDTLPSNI